LPQSAPNGWPSFVSTVGGAPLAIIKQPIARQKDV